MLWTPVKFLAYSSQRQCSERLASHPVQLEVRFIAAQCHCLYAAEPRSLWLFDYKLPSSTRSQIIVQSAGALFSIGRPSSTRIAEKTRPLTGSLLTLSPPYRRIGSVSIACLTGCAFTRHFPAT